MGMVRARINMGTNSICYVVKSSRSSYSKPRDALRGTGDYEMWLPFILVKNCCEARALLLLQISSISRAAEHNTITLPLHLLSELV